MLLDAPFGMLAIPAEATEDEIARLRRMRADKNRRIYAELRGRGLLPPKGHNLPAHEVNEHLTSRPPDELPPKPAG